MRRNLGYCDRYDKRQIWILCLQWYSLQTLNSVSVFTVIWKSQAVKIDYSFVMRKNNRYRPILLSGEINFFICDYGKFYPHLPSLSQKMKNQYFCPSFLICGELIMAAFFWRFEVALLHFTQFYLHHLSVHLRANYEKKPQIRVLIACSCAKTNTKTKPNTKVLVRSGAFLT